MKNKIGIKKYLVSLLLFLGTFNCYSQFGNPVDVEEPLPRLYIGPGTGLNSFTGVLGGQAEYRLTENIVGGVGLGIGGWGTKFSTGLWLYKKFPKHFSLGLSFSTCSGIDDYSMNLNLQNPEVDSLVDIDLLRANTLNLALGYHIKLGKRNRLNFELGYSFPLTEEPYRLHDKSIVLSDLGKFQLAVLQPGGVAFSISFSFGIK